MSHPKRPNDGRTKEEMEAATANAREELRLEVEKLKKEKSIPDKSFLEVTIKDITASGHKPEDIIFIGSEVSGYRCNWEEFKELCKQQTEDLSGVYYDAPTDLIIVFNDGIKMDRYNSDRGNEDFWRYQKPFVPPVETKPMTKLFAKWNSTIEEVHEDPESNV